MHIEKHSLVLEWPEQRERIHALKLANSHFARLFDEYHDLDQQIVRIEDGVEHLGDLALEALKKQRVHLKDALWQLLNGAPRHSCCGSCG